MNDSKSTILKRIFAWICLLFFFGVFISLIINLVRGASPGVILAHLFCLIVIPCIIYLIQFVKKRLEH